MRKQSLAATLQQITENWIMVVQSHINKFPFGRFYILLADERSYYLTKRFNNILDVADDEIKYCHQMCNRQIALEVINTIAGTNRNVTLLPENSEKSCKVLVYKTDDVTLKAEDQ